MSLTILADANIPYAERAFAHLGRVLAVPAQELGAELARDADLVLTRSTVKLGPELLGQSRAKFVATATSGVDHVDQGWLAARGVGFASAHGSNARSVAEWFTAAVLTLAQRHGLALGSLRVGIVGVGAVGEHVRQVCQALGLSQIHLCDPPRQRRGDLLPQPWSSLEQVLENSDIVTVHVPLIKEGPDKTLGMLGAQALSRLPQGALVLNAARGDVLPGEVILEEQGRLRFALDVWPSEPAVEAAHVAAAQLGTPHIAGHSLDAKVQGTLQIYRAACAFLGVEPRWEPGPQELPRFPVVELEAAGRPWQEVALEAVQASYRILEDVAAMEALAALPPQERGLSFRRWRQGYAPRREFAATRLRLVGADARTQQVLSGLGFCLESL